MDFFSIVMFLGLSYVRPQEWIPFIGVLQPVKIAMIIGVVSMLMKQRQGSLLKDLFYTPHDWIMLIYIGYMIITAPDLQNTFNNFYTHFLFYLVTVQALSNMERIQRYLIWWTVFIMFVPIFALASEYGFDPTHSHPITHGRRMGGRLMLNLYIFNNPNSLGHSVVPAIVMLYFVMFWKRPVFLKIATIPVMFFPLYCIYLTLSKGAFITGFATIVSALTFRRPKAVQLTIFITAFTIGFAGLKTLPRMQEMDNAKGEEGIQGRLMAFQFGYRAIKSYPLGVGCNKFMAAFKRMYGFEKAPHSTYVQVGTELGYPGLFMFMAVLYCCMRTLLTAKTTTIEEERVRRILFVLLISFMVSSWMIGWAYRASFFLTVAAIAAFHRQMLLKAKALSENATIPLPEPEMVITVGGVETPLSKSKDSPAQSSADPGAPRRTVAQTETEPKVVNPGIRWNRFRLLDFGLIALMTIATVQVWIYLMHNI